MPTSPKSLDRTLLATARAQVADWLDKYRTTDNVVEAVEAMWEIERNLAQVLTSLYEGLVDAESERDAALARAEKAEAALATAREEEREAVLNEMAGW